MKNYLAKIKEKLPIKIYLLLIFILLAFGFGLLSSLKQVGERSWVPAVIDKAKIALGMTKLKEFKGGLSVPTSRYDFETIFKSSQPGQYQIATTDGTDVIAIDRNTGRLISLAPQGESYAENVLSESVFPDGV